ncbi:MAG: S1C family serine protease [Halobacteriota archaeon]
MAVSGPTRRRFLIGAAGALAGTAGCLRAPTGGRSPTGTPTESRPTASPVEPPEETDARYADVYQATIDAVAMVRAYGPEGPIGQGSGFVYEGPYLLTNEHVVRGASDAELQFRDNEWTEGSVVGTDPHSDLAVIEAEALPASATPLPPAETRATVGQEVIALGNPFGLEESVSQGIVSGRNRSLPGGTDFRIPATIQTDASVNPGNSGGPLVTMRGRFLGVITARAGQDIGFAVSWRLVERVAPALIETGSYDHSFLGVQLQQVDPGIAGANALEEVTGVIVVEAVPGGPAEGILEGSTTTRIDSGRQVPVGGDVIVALDETSIETSEALSTYLALHTSPGDDVEVTVLRDGRQETVTVELGVRPD